MISTRAGAQLVRLAPGGGSIPSELRGGVAAIGNFDGVHPGHQRLLSEADLMARSMGRPAFCLTFEPHPRTVFNPDQPVFRLTPPEAKRRLCSGLGLAGLVIAEFGPHLAALSAEEFVQTILVDSLAVKAVVVGEDFRFGKNRVGTSQTLQTLGEWGGFSVEAVKQVIDQDGRPYGSGRVRAALAEGAIARANALLGYRWFVIGTVAAGDQRGRLLGYPTANLHMPTDCRLRYGIYAVMVTRPGGRPLPGVASFGRRPTFGGGEPVLEAHIFGFAGDLYGESITVTFPAGIRPEARFDSAESLIRQMDADAARAAELLSAAGPGSPLDQRLAALG